MLTLRNGSRGSLVELLQLGLTRAGYYTGEIDGIFGNETESAVRNFQRAYGLVADGVAGSVTFAALRPYQVGYTRYTVRPGDTFFSISGMLNSTVSLIQTANPGVTSAQLAIGSVLRVPFNFPLVPTNISYSSYLMDYLAEGLKVRYPFMTVTSAGSSVMGNPLHLFVIGAGSKKVFYNASHHANEWITTPVLMKFIEDYANAISLRGEIGNRNALTLYNTVSLYLVPMVNPDGVNLVTGAIDQNSTFYRQAVTYGRNYPAIPFPSGWKSNINGVDLNLTYPAEWYRAREVKFAAGFTVPGPRDFVGDYPLSQPESRAIYDLTRDNNFALTLSYHTQGRVIYWKFMNYQPPKSFEIAQMMGKASGYAIETTPTYSAYAGYKDWFIQTYNRPGYTVEVGEGVNPLPVSQFPTIYNENIGILLIGMTES